MSSRSQKNIIHHQIPGTISIISRQNTLNNPSLVHDVWQFEHDPDDQYLLDAFNRQSQSLKRHSYQEIHISMDKKHRKLIKKNNIRTLEHSSQVTIEMEKRNQYGLIRSQKNISDQKTVNKNKKQKENQTKQIKYKDKKNSFRANKEYQNKLINQNGPQQDNSKDQELNQFLNRDIDILNRKSISNINFLINQTKELINMNKQIYLDIQRQQIKKLNMKLQIEVRKLKISLRSNNLSKLSEQNLVGKKKKSLLRSYKSQQSEKQQSLLQTINLEKRKNHQLSTRQSILYNYYNVIKSRPDLHQISQMKLQRSQKRRKYTTSILKNFQEMQNHYELLKNKKDILLSSLKETQKHIKRKCEQITCQKKLIKDQISIMQSKLRKFDEINLKKYQLTPTKSRLGNIQRSIINHNFQDSKSKRKLNLKSNSQQKQQVYFTCHKNKNFNIDRVKSHKQILWGKDNRAKRISPNYENQYFINSKYYRHR